MRTYLYLILLGPFMANRTISLSPIGDLIRKKLVERTDLTFSSWVEARLMEWNSTEQPSEEVQTVNGFKVPWYYECQLCHQKGHHASNCSMYNPVIESGGEEE